MTVAPAHVSPPDRRRWAALVVVCLAQLMLVLDVTLTEALSWHWVFFVNLPIGVATFALAHALIRGDRGLGFEYGVDWLGSLLVTASLMAAISAIVGATTHGWLSAHVLGVGSLATVLMAAFLALEARVENPILPLRVLRLRGLVNASVVRAYLERVRHNSALETGAAFLPWTLTVAVLLQGITARLIRRFGPPTILVPGMLIAATGLLVFSTVGPDTRFFPTIFLACFTLGLGIGSAFMPLVTLAMEDVPVADAGLGSGITNVAHGIVAADHTKGLVAHGESLTDSLLSGYHLGFLTAAATVAAGALLAFALLRPSEAPPRLQLATTTPPHPDLEQEAA
jgi:hypothetical protein